MTWLEGFVPRLIQSVSSLVTTLIAAATALYIARFVYGRQKDLDARYRLADEMRSTCAKLAEACTSIIEDPAAVKNEAALQSVGFKLAQVNYYENLLIMQRAPTRLVESAQRLSRAYGACLKYLYERFASNETPDAFPELAKDLFEKRASFVLEAREQTARLP